MNDLQLLSHLIAVTGADLSSARESAHALLNAYGPLAKVFAQPKARLMHFPGLDEPAASFLILIPILIERYRKAGTEPGCPKMERPQDVTRLVTPYFAGKRSERVCVFCLNERYEFVTGSLIAEGNNAAVSCPVSRVLELALNHHSDRVLLVHNHPDGAAAFSKSDLLATGILAHTLSMAEVNLADHLLLAGNKILSLREFSTSGYFSFSPPSDWRRAPWPYTRMTLPPSQKRI